MSENSLDVRKVGYFRQVGVGVYKTDIIGRKGVYLMIRDYLHVTSQTPHLNIYQALWENLYDSSWIARDLAQTLLSVQGSHMLSQIGQLGLNVTIVLYSIFFVMVDGMYRNHVDDILEEIGQ